MNSALAQAQETEITRTPNLEELVRAFLQEQDISERSRQTYGRSLVAWLRWLRDTGRDSRLGTLVREDVLQYKTALLEAGKSPATVSTYLVAVRRLYEWLEGRKLYPNISRGIKGAKSPKGHRKDVLTEAQLREVLDSTRAQSLEGLRDFALINLAARTGLRTIEIARVLVEDIRQESGTTVLWVQGKGRDSKDEYVILTPEAEKPIRDYLAARREREDSSPLFASHSQRNRGQALTTRSISRIIKTSFRRVGLDSKRLTAHSLRHTAVTLAAKNGASLEQTMAMARHQDSRTTLVYYRNLKRLDDAAERRITF